MRSFIVDTSIGKSHLV